MSNIAVKKTIDLCVPEISLDHIQDLRERFSIPGDAYIRQNSDDYDLSIQWTSE